MTEYYNIQNPMCVDLDSNITELCFTKEDCSPTSDLILKECDKLFNCNLCAGQQAYFVPFRAGDTIDFQLRELDPNPNQENPTSGWGTWINAEICDTEGNTVNNDIDTFTVDYMVGYHQGPYQLIRVDTTTLPDCWSLKVTVNGKELCSEPFKRAHEKEDLICIESDYFTFDCDKNYYGAPDAFFGTNEIVYNNKLCFYGTLERLPGAMTRTTANNKTQSTEFRENYQLRFSQPFPLFKNDYLLKILMGGDTIRINGMEYEADSFAPENLTNNGMYLYTLNLFRECDNNSANC